MSDPNTQNEIHLNDIGTVFEATVCDNGVVVDISAATTMELVFKSPRGASVTQTATHTTDGTDGKMEYATISGDLSAVGVWLLQGHVILASGEWRTDVVEFMVHKNI